MANLALALFARVICTTVTELVASAMEYCNSRCVWIKVAVVSCSATLDGIQALVFHRLVNSILVFVQYACINIILAQLLPNLSG